MSKIAGRYSPVIRDWQRIHDQTLGKLALAAKFRLDSKLGDLVPIHNVMLDMADVDVKLDSKILFMPYTLTDLLEMRAKDNHVVVTGGSYNFRNIIMSFICNLRRLNVTSYILAAFDAKMYEFRCVPNNCLS